MQPVITVRGDGPPPSPEPDPPPRRWTAPGPATRRKLLIGALAVWAVVITGLVLFRGGSEEKAPVATPPQASPSASDAPLTVAQVYQALLPSVVRITSTGKAGASANAKSMAESSTGTGVIANADGTILTAAHVIEGAVAIKITYADGTTSAAEVAGADVKQDIATLTPARLPETLVPATLGGGLQVGDEVVAIGNPLGLTASTTDGVVSGLDRTMSREENGDITGLIQFDAAVNPGSSGGPLINDRGQVAGIVVALANPTDAGTFIGIGFAVPIGAALGATGQGNGQTPPL
jgi:S1-C subfamily serine protease